MSINYKNPVGLALADLRLKAQEDVGPKTNSRSVAMLHPDMYQSSADLGRTQKTTRANQRSAWLPDNKLNNIQLKKNYEVYPTHQLLGSDIGVTGQYLQGEETVYVAKQYAERVIPTDYSPVDALGALEVPEEQQILIVAESNIPVPY